MACKATVDSTSLTGNITGTTTTSGNFVGGTKVVKILTSNDTSAPAGSFSGFVTSSTAIPVSTPIPSGYPGYDGSSQYLPGVSATQFYDVDGTTVVTKPAWLTDVQLGVTSNVASSACATFGGSGQYDVNHYYRVSEADCGSSTGSGSSVDPVFIRIILNRSSTYLGSSENLLIQVEYQASGIRLNSDGVSTSPEGNVDQLWKVFWNSTLLSSSTPKPFSLFVPPNYAACLSGGSGGIGAVLGGTGAPGACPAGGSTTYNGAPTVIKQIMIPISAYPTLSVIQISRISGRINNLNAPSPAPTFAANTLPVNYVSAFCGTSDSPLCLGLVVRSITIMRI